MTVLRSGSASDVGRVRTINEDRSLESMSLFAVADGMGGHAGGEVAASIAVSALESGFTRTPTADGLVAAVQEANRAVWERGAEDQALRGMGTTVVAAALVATADGDRLVLVNVGDSRVYRLHSGALTQLSSDHSVAEELVARGELSEAEAAVHPHRHILTRALGVAPAVEVDVWDVAPLEGDRYLLCSDGLTNEVLPDLITSVLATIRDPKAAAQKLVDLANESGGSDNITAVVLDVLVGELPDPAAEPGLAEAGDAPASDLTGSVVAADVSRASAVGAVGVGAKVIEQPSPISGEERKATLRRRGPRRITFRVIFFLILLGGLAYAAWFVIKSYVDDSYYVSIKNNELVIYQGRPGGFLGIEPSIVDHTGVVTAQVGKLVVPALHSGVQEPTRSAANRYVNRLVTAQCALENPAPSCTTSTTTTLPPAPTTTVPTATTSVKAP